MNAFDYWYSRHFGPIPDPEDNIMDDYNTAKDGYIAGLRRAININKRGLGGHPLTPCELNSLIVNEIELIFHQQDRFDDHLADAYYDLTHEGGDE